MRVNLHWLDVPERVKFKLVLMVHTAFITKLPGTWRTTAFRSPMWPVDDNFVLPGFMTWLCLDTVSARMGVGHLLLPAQLPKFTTYWFTYLTSCYHKDHAEKQLIYKTRWGYKSRNRCSFSRFLKVSRDGAEVTSTGRSYHVWAPATRKVRLQSHSRNE